MEVIYNCWHGCHKKSEGCLNCYVFRRDESIGKDTNVVTKTASFALPVRRKRDGSYKYPSGTLFMMCFSSDFFLEEADEWREDVLSFIGERSDCRFYCITKRPERIKLIDVREYPNLTICCTCENQKRLEERMPYYLPLELYRKEIILEPMLEEMDLAPYINDLDAVSLGGESGDNARPLNFDWVRKIARQCREAGIPFHFHQTGANLIKDGKLYRIPRNLQHSQAAKAMKLLR
jgi:protein gp37